MLAAVNRLFSDRSRWVLIPLACGWLLFLGARYARFSAEAQPGYEGCVDAPASCEDHAIYMAIWTVVEVGADGYGIRKVSGEVPVIGDPAGLEVGDRVSVVGWYDPQSRAVVEERRSVHTWRWAKELLSGLGALAVLALLPARFAWRSRRVVERG